MRVITFIASIITIVLASAYTSLPGTAMSAFVLAFMSLVASIVGAVWSAGSMLKAHFTKRNKGLRYVQMYACPALSGHLALRKCHP